MQARALEAGPTSRVCVAWIKALSQADGRCAARALYAGRSFTDSLAAAGSIDAGLYVVSAGLGLVRAETAVPSYDLTVTAGAEDDILTRIDGPAAAWWSALTAASPFSAEIVEDGLILAALPRPYLEMVQADWEQWPAERMARLRLFSKTAPDAAYPRLRGQHMPYDDRLDGLGPGRGGTQGDFAQRALRHFVDAHLPHSTDATADARRVARGLQPVAVTVRKAGQRASDEEILATIDRQWEAVGGRSGAMLRRLRDELAIACEQSRFARLFRQAAAMREGRLL